MTERISVMCVSHNGLPYLAEALDSVLSQDHPAVELVVVDDGSTDGTAEVLAAYGDRLVAVRQERAGIAVARNTALSHATGDLLACLDADDRLRPHALSVLSQVLAEDHDLDAVFAHVTEFVSPELDEQWRRRLRPPVDRIAGRLPTTMLARRAVFDRVGPFTEGLRRGVTLDWTARALEAGTRTRVLDDVLFERRLHRTNNGITEAASTSDYVRVVKAALDRRREEVRKAMEVADAP